MNNFLMFFWILSVDTFLFFVTRLLYKLVDHLYFSKSDILTNDKEIDDKFWSKEDFH